METEKFANCIYDTPWPAEKAFATKDRLLMLDFESDCPSTILSNVAWYHKPDEDAKAPHAHTCGEILAFLGSDLEHPEELGGQITMYLNGEKHVMTKSFFVFIPANLPHCPYSVDRIDRPIFHTSYPISRKMTIRRFPGLPVQPEDAPKFFDENFVQTLSLPDDYSLYPGEIPILYTDSRVCPGSFMCCASWYTKADSRPLIPQSVHACDTLLLIAGSDPAAPFDLGGKVNFTIGGERYLIDRTSYLFIPAGTPYSLDAEELSRPIILTRTRETN